MDEKRQFKGIWIPAEIWLNPKLTFVEKLVWAEIDSLSSKEQPCCASNDYFVKILGIDERRIQRAMRTLKQVGLIKQVAFNGRTRMLISSLEKKESDSNRDGKNEQGRGDNNTTPEVTPIPPLEHINQENNIYTPYSPPKGECQSLEDFDSRNQGKNLSDQPKNISKTNPDKFFPGSSGSKDDEQIPSVESLRSSKNKESSQNQKFLRGESNTNIVQLTNEESVNDRVFEELWQAYVPYVAQDGRSTNKGSKKLAKEKFIKTVSKGVNPNDVLRGTRRYIEDCHNHKTLTKNVITFLNQEQWRDYLIACNIKNNHPLNISGLAPFGSKEEFIGFFGQETYKPFINDNPSFFETVQNIRACLTNGNIEKSILMAQELANEVWEYKDTTQIRNSILDPILWALCRFEINPRESKSAIMIVGYFLRRLWLEEKRRLVENKS